MQRHGPPHQLPSRRRVVGILRAALGGHLGAASEALFDSLRGKSPDAFFIGCAGTLTEDVEHRIWRVSMSGRR